MTAVGVVGSHATLQIGESSCTLRFARTFGVALVPIGDDDTIGLKGQFVFGGGTHLTVNQVDHKLEVCEVTAHRLRDDEFGDSLGIPSALVGIDPFAQGLSEQSMFYVFMASPRR